MQVRSATALLLLALATAAPAAAHGAEEAAELEILLLDDEPNDLASLGGAYDVGRVFLGEAHKPSFAAGPAGDGVYFRAALAFDDALPSAPVETRRVVFSFETPDGRVERFIETSDGETFETDFDVLAVDSGEGEVRVQRAFVAYASLGVEPGSALAGFVVESFADGELRDRAPGGVYPPGPLGPLAEIPLGESVVVTPEHVLAGVGGYARVDVAEEAPGLFALTVTSRLEEGKQHAMFADVHAQEGWVLAPEGESSATLEPGEAHTFRVRLLADAPAAALRFDLLTDVGGRVGLVADNVDNVITLRPEEGAAGPPLRPASVEEQVPAPAPGLVAFALAATAFVARRTRE